MSDQFIYGADESVARWAESQISDCQFRSDARAIGCARDGVLIAAVVYDTFSTTSCFVHVAASARKWFSNEFAIRAMAYPFIQCGFERISCIVSERNRLSLRLTHQFGWTREGRLRRAGPQGEDILLFGMLREECRYISGLLGPAGKSTGSAV